MPRSAERDAREALTRAIRAPHDANRRARLAFGSTDPALRFKIVRERLRVCKAALAPLGAARP
jgi:hypothetical protein